jgi:hypothetical protein
MSGISENNKHTPESRKREKADQADKEVKGEARAKTQNKNGR